MSRMSELRDAIERALLEEGVPRPYEFSVARNAHQQVEFYVQGVRVKYQFACSPSGGHWQQAAKKGLRHAIRSAKGRAIPAASAA